MAIDLNKLNFDGIETPDLVTPVDATAIAAAQLEIDNEKAFGASPVKSALAGAARGATFGLSDQAMVKSGLVDANTLKELQERNPKASIAGEIAGAVAPALIPGGQATAVGAVAKAGLISEKFIASALLGTGSKVLAKSIVQKTVPKIAGSAVEGAAYGLGQLVSEDALGKADFNAENLVASAGLGAITGGATGGTIGALFGKKQALVPIVGSGGTVKDIALKTVSVSDPNYQAWKLAGKTPTEVTKLLEKNKVVFNNAQSYLQRSGTLGLTDSAATFFEKVHADIGRIGSEIGDTLVQTDSILTSRPDLMLNKRQVGNAITDRLEELKNTFKGLPLEEAKKNVKRIDKDIKNLKSAYNSLDPITGQELQNLKIQFQQQARWDKTGQLPVAENIAREGSRALRDQLLNLADNVSIAAPESQLGSKLRQLNLDYGTATELSSGLQKKASKDAEKGFISLKDTLLAGVGVASDFTGIAAAGIGVKNYAESDFRRKLNILTNVEKNTVDVAKRIGNSVNDFMSGTGGKFAPRSLSILNDSFLTKDLSQQKPSGAETKVGALQNLQKNIDLLRTDPEKLGEILIRATSHLKDTIPNTADNVDQVFMRALNFLNTKIPKQSADIGALQILGKKPWQPSSLETAKFERYMHALDNPLQALEDLKANALAPETVEVLRNVYPNLYMQIKAKVMEKAPAMADKMSYKQKAQLSLLFDAPVDYSFKSSSIKALQTTFLQQEGPTGGSGRSQAASKPLAAIGNSQSGTEAILTRK